MNCVPRSSMSSCVIDILDMQAEAHGPAYLVSHTNRNARLLGQTYFVFGSLATEVVDDELDASLCPFFAAVASLCTAFSSTSLRA